MDIQTCVDNVDKTGVSIPQMSISQVIVFVVPCFRKIETRAGRIQTGNAADFYSIISLNKLDCIMVVIIIRIIYINTKLSPK